MTGLTLLTASFSDCGVIAEGETLSAPLAQDGLRRVNNMIGGWRTQYGTVQAIERVIFPLIANQQTYTIGPGGDFNVPRPMTIPAAGLWLNGLSGAVSVSSLTRSGTVATVTSASHGFSVGDEAYIAGATPSAYNGLQTVRTVPTANTFTFTIASTTGSPATGTITVAAVDGEPVEIPRAVITDAAYQAIQIKNLSDSLFTLVYYNPKAANAGFGEIFLWPKPTTADNQLVLYLQSGFTGFADLTTDYDYPDNPGYAEALQYQLDRRLILPYAVKDPDVLQKIREMSAETFGLIKRANNKLSDLPNDAQVLVADRRGGYNIQTGD